MVNDDDIRPNFLCRLDGVLIEVVTTTDQRVGGKLVLDEVWYKRAGTPTTVANLFGGDGSMDRAEFAQRAEPA